MQKLWDRLGDSRALRALSPQSLDELLSACIDAAVSELDPHGNEPLAGPALARERRRTARLVRKLLELERTRAPFRVQRTEYEARLRLADQELKLRIDRLDALESGGVAILDYKSGRRVSADWYGERPSHPQLLAYLAAVGEGVVAMVDDQRHCERGQIRRHFGDREAASASHVREGSGRPAGGCVAVARAGVARCRGSGWRATSPRAGRRSIRCRGPATTVMSRVYVAWAMLSPWMRAPRKAYRAWTMTKPPGAICNDTRERGGPRGSGGEAQDGAEYQHTEPAHGSARG